MDRARGAPVRPGLPDLELVGAAVSALRRGLGARLHPSAAAVRTSSGAVVTGLGLGPDLCAEPVAVGAVLSRGERVVAIAAVRHLDDDATRVTAPCAGCRALLRVHAPAVLVVHLADGLRVGPVDALP